MPKPIPCRPLPLWVRMPRAIVVGLVLIVGFSVFFAVASLYEITGGGK